MSMVPDRVSSQGLDVGGLSVATQSAAESAIAALDQAIHVVSRSNMGAMINRLSNTVNNDQAALENMQATESRSGIRTWPRGRCSSPATRS